MVADRNKSCKKFVLLRELNDWVSFINIWNSTARVVKDVKIEFNEEVFDCNKGNVENLKDIVTDSSNYHGKIITFCCIKEIVLSINDPSMEIGNIIEGTSCEARMNNV